MQFSKQGKNSDRANAKLDKYRQELLRVAADVVKKVPGYYCAWMSLGKPGEEENKKS